MRRGSIIAVCCVLLVVLAGCSGAGGGDAASGGSDIGASADEAAEAEAAADATASSDSGSDAGSGDGGAGVRAQVGSRDLIYEADVTLRVDDFEAARADLTAMARDRGGYVGASTQRVRGEGNRTWTTGRLVLRVPAGEYNDTIGTVRDRGEVRSFDESTTDVTDQVTDLEARLESLRAERDRLRELYDEANDTEDVLAVQRELSDVQTEIERTEARLRGLERRVAFATITVELSEPRPEPEPREPDRWYDTPATQAFLESVDGVVVALRGAVVLTAYALPYLAVLSLPAVGVAAAYRRVRG